jgi:hypothetical protein
MKNNLIKITGFWKAKNIKGLTQNNSDPEYTVYLSPVEKKIRGERLTEW